MSGRRGTPWDQYTATESGLYLTDNTINDVSITRHGFVPKAPNDAGKYLRGDGTWATLSGSGGAIPEWVTGNPMNFTADAFAANDNFGVGSSIDTAGTRFSGATAWTARLVTTLTNDVTDGALHLVLPQTTSTIWQGYTQPMVAGDCRYRTTFTVGGRSQDFHSVGVFVERGTGASRRMTVYAVGFNSGAGSEDKRVDRFSTDSDTYNSTPFSDGGPDFYALRIPWWVDVEYSGTNIKFYVATHRGRHFINDHTEAEATWLGGRADRIGIGLLNANNTNGNMEGWFEGFWRIA